MSADLEETVAAQLYEAHEGLGGDTWADLLRDYPILAGAWRRVAARAIEMAHAAAAEFLRDVRG